VLTRTSTRPGTGGRRNVELLISDCCFTNSTPFWVLGFGSWKLCMSLDRCTSTGVQVVYALGKGTPSNI
jgi:hypothetical protein